MYVHNISPSTMVKLRFQLGCHACRMRGCMNTGRKKKGRGIWLDWLTHLILLCSSTNKHFYSLSIALSYWTLYSLTPSNSSEFLHSLFTPYFCFHFLFHCHALVQCITPHFAPFFFLSPPLPPPSLSSFTLPLSSCFQWHLIVLLYPLALLCAPED